MLKVIRIIKTKKDPRGLVCLLIKVSHVGLEPTTP